MVLLDDIESLTLKKSYYHVLFWMVYFDMYAFAKTNENVTDIEILLFVLSLFNLQIFTYKLVNSHFEHHIILEFWLQYHRAQSAWAVEYANCILAEG